MRAFSTVGSFTLMSRILGFMRDVLMAQFLGAGLAADCFFVAFKLPNFFRRLFAEGAFSSAFVPLFSRILGRDPTPTSRHNARIFAQEALAVLLPILLVFTGLMQAVMPWAMLVLAPGFADQPEKFALAVDLTRLTFPYLLLISLVSLFSGILNGLGRFSEAAAAPILLNLVLISSLLLFHDTAIMTAKALAIAVSLAGVVQLLLLLYGAHRMGFSLSLPRPKLTPAVKRLLTVMLPVALGAGMTQINLMIDVILASMLPEGSLSFLFYADRLNQLPLGVIGIAVGTVLLPHLSRTLAGGSAVEAIHHHNRAIEFALILTLPAAFALATVPQPLISALFQHGAFTADDSQATAWALAAFAAGLPAFVLIKVLVPGFYAREDMKTPVKIALLALVTNLVLNLLLMGPLRHVGLALATSIAAWLNAALLYVNLHRRSQFALDARLKSRLLRVIASCGLMAAVLFGLDHFFGAGRGASKAMQVGQAALLVVSGLGVYGVASLISGAFRLSEIKNWR
ncbi:putative lipid II flippase MurJ [Iodidimonas gelatinilytica]|uniref:Probable lipid II flippase MurJ n=2 Tax=Iodidimonas gelatinilytica TaxID=1236966 RepID=A0A5A7MNM3_9PROT|nr:putative lipid II flippase MurJ [Iodidimonas gelatinilytica]